MYFAASIISDLIGYAALKGVNTTLLTKSYLPAEGEKYVSYDQVASLFGLLREELADEHLGLHIGELLALKATEHVDDIMRHSQTLEASFENASHYSRLISDALDTSLHKTKDDYSVIFDENPNWSVEPAYARKQILDLTVLSCLKSLVTYTKRAYYPKVVRLQTERPRRLNEYYRLFNCSIHFGEPRSEVVFQKQIFDRYAREVPIGLLETLKSRVDHEIQSLGKENELIYSLKKCILRSTPLRLSIGAAADQLHFSTRTLQRRLTDLGVTYKQIEGELLLRLAKTYLQENKKSVDEISYLVGFSESSAFIRFFKQHTGETPTGYARS